VKREADALQASGMQSHVICLRDESEPWREEIDGVQVYRLPVRHRRGKILRYIYEYNAFFALASFLLIWLHARHRLRAVQVHTMPDYLVFCALVPKLTGSRVVLHLHEPMPELFGTLFQRWYRAPFMVLITSVQRTSIAFADRATTVTREMKDTFAHHGSNVGKVTVVLNVPDDKMFRLDLYEHIGARVAAIKAEDRRCGMVRVFTHGAIEDRYGNDTIVRALPRLTRRFPGAQFRLVERNDGFPVARRNQLLHLVRARGIADHSGYLLQRLHLRAVEVHSQIDVGALEFPVPPVRRCARAPPAAAPINAPTPQDAPSAWASIIPPFRERPCPTRIMSQPPAH
jgi:glycosyltransferase involved in cell wall biosynthesis